jgi:hypothetical protein
MDTGAVNIADGIFGSGVYGLGNMEKLFPLYRISIGRTEGKSLEGP